MAGQGQNFHEGLKNMEITALEGPMTRGKLRKLLEVHKELSLFKGQEGPTSGQTFTCLWILGFVNRVVNNTTSNSPFKLVYDFNPYCPLDLLSLPNKVHEKTQLHIERKGKQYAKQANKGKKEWVFKEGDLVWVYLRRQRFPTLRKPKLLQRMIDLSKF
ncbi:hypothetical protein CR513_29666, partial [Mucuna pruriens]